MILRPTQKGLVAEGEFMRWIFPRGYSEIAKPLEHDRPYDFLIFCSIKQAWLKVQVKSTYSCKRGKSREVNFRRGRTKKRTAYVEGDFDWMFVWDSISNTRYWIPWTALCEIKSCFVVSGTRFEKYRIP